MTPDLFTETLPPSDGTGRTLTAMEYIAWQAKHDAKRQAVSEYEQDMEQNKAKVTP
jgi:hypothetical protein